MRPPFPGRALATALLFALFPARGGAAEPPRRLLPFEPGDTLEEIREKIARNGYSFTVAPNWVYDMPEEMKREFLSRRAPRFPSAPSDDIGPLEARLGKTALPIRFDWRDREGRSYIGPIRNQGNCGSCYAFAACAAAEGVFNWAFNLHDDACADFSEAFIAWCLGGKRKYNNHFYGCEGADYDYYELEALTQEGIAFESAYPYSPRTFQQCPDSAWSSPMVRFDSWHRVGCNDIDAIKTAILTYGVVDAAVWAGAAFQAYSGGVYEDTNTACAADPCYYATTNHAVALVGWDDSPPEEGGGIWILRNSWGDGWGEGGYMRLRYTAALVACAAAYLAGPSAVPTPTPAPAPTPPPAPAPGVEVRFNKSSFLTSDDLRVDVLVGPLGAIFDAWGVILGPDGVVYSFDLGDPTAIRRGAMPLATGVPGLVAPYGAVLFSASFSGAPPGDYSIIVGLVPAGIRPAGPESALPNYAAVSRVAVSPPE
ncbi:MAG: C1 family peptidase [bacterium]|nr:C1 family peptidase [bacterium]